MKKNNKGFTLIEIGIVLFVVGILVAIMMPSFTGGIKDTGRATELYSTAQKVVSGWSQVAKECSVGTTVAGNALPGSGKSVLDVMGDFSTANSSYSSCINASSARPLGDVIGPTGAHKVLTYATTLSDSINSYTTGKLCVTYTAVPDAIVLPIVQKYGSGVTALAVSDATHPSVQYGTASAGARDISICSQP